MEIWLSIIYKLRYFVYVGWKHPLKWLLAAYSVAIIAFILIAV